MAAERGYLKILAEVDLSKPLLRGTTLRHNSQAVWVDFRYEKLALFCFYYGYVGHSDLNCGVRKTDVLNGTVHEGEYGDWLRADTSKPKSKHSPSTPLSSSLNPFSALSFSRPNVGSPAATPTTSSIQPDPQIPHPTPIPCPSPLTSSSPISPPDNQDPSPSTLPPTTLIVAPRDGSRPPPATASPSVDLPQVPLSAPTSPSTLIPTTLIAATHDVPRPPPAIARPPVDLPQVPLSAPTSPRDIPGPTNPTCLGLAPNTLINIPISYSQPVEVPHLKPAPLILTEGTRPLPKEVKPRKKWQRVKGKENSPPVCPATKPIPAQRACGKRPWVLQDEPDILPD